MAAPALFRSSTLVHFSSPGFGWARPAPSPPTRGPWPPPWGVSLPPAWWPPAPFRVLLRTLPLNIVRFCEWCSDCFMSVWNLQKLEMLWTWTLSWALRHKWLIRGCLLAAQACRVSVAHSDCYSQIVTPNQKSATLEVNKWESRQSLSSPPTFLSWLSSYSLTSRLCPGPPEMCESLQCHQSNSDRWAHLVSVGLHILTIHSHQEVPRGQTSKLRYRGAVNLKCERKYLNVNWRMNPLFRTYQTLIRLCIVSVTVTLLYFDSWQISVWIPDPWQLTMSGNTGVTSPWHLGQRGIRIL